MNVKCYLFMKQCKEDHKNYSAEIQQATSASAVIFICHE